MKRTFTLFSVLLLAGTDVWAAEITLQNQARVYPAGRPAATLRLEATDQGVVLKHGDGPGQCDTLGARDVGLAWLKLPLNPPALAKANNQ
jgi:hypothetical protein